MGEICDVKIFVVLLSEFEAEEILREAASAGLLSMGRAWILSDAGAKLGLMRRLCSPSASGRSGPSTRVSQRENASETSSSDNGILI